MNLIEENFEDAPKMKGTGKIGKILLIIIAILVIICVILIISLQYLNKNTLKVTLNGSSNATIKEMLVFQEDGTVYVPIKKIAKQFGYESFNGNSNSKSEELNKCYVQTKDETSNYALNSKSIYKITNDEKQGTINSYYNIDKEVISVNGELCTTIDGIEKGFNVIFDYDKENNKITIYTMPYLISLYEKKVLDLGYDEISKDFNDRKTVLKNMLVVKKGKNDDAKYAVIDTNKGSNILELKYKNISYLPDTEDFLVADNNNVGLLSSTGETKIRIEYDDIKLLDSSSNLYIVEKNKKFGVVNSNGKTIVGLDYDEIGVDTSKFPKNDIKNKYLLADNLIPLKKGDLWGFADKNGKILVNFEYDSLGYVATSNKDTENLLVIEDYNVVVACKNKKYLLINSLGAVLFNGYKFDDVYMTSSSTQKNYWIVPSDGNRRSAEEYLDKIGAKKVSQNSSNNSSSQEDDSDSSSQDTNNTISQDVNNITSQNGNTIGTNNTNSNKVTNTNKK